MKEPKKTPKRKPNIKKAVLLCVAFVAIPALILLGVVAFNDRMYLWISICIAVLACLPFFISFELRGGFGKKSGTAPECAASEAQSGRGTTRLIILASMTALSVLGRFIFAPLPFFKPVTAIVVITGMYLGAESGFLCGALSAILSNIMFGQGPWTPFQMFTWGIIGLFAGLMAGILKRNRIILSVFGVLAGVLFSFTMDIWTVLWWDGKFSFSRYLTALASAAGVTAVYAVSNVIFLWLLARPLGSKLERIIVKYGV
mgnify:FL=1